MKTTRPAMIEARHTEPERRGAMPKLFVGLLIGALIAGGIYMLAVSMATSMAAGFSTVESSRHAGIIEFETAMRQASHEQRAARITCESYTGTKKNICNVRAEASALRAQSAARITYTGVVSNRPSTLY